MSSRLHRSGFRSFLRILVCSLVFLLIGTTVYLGQAQEFGDPDLAGGTASLNWSLNSTGSGSLALYIVNSALAHQTARDSLVASMPCQKVILQDQAELAETELAGADYPPFLSIECETTPTQQGLEQITSLNLQPLLDRLSNPDLGDWKLETLSLTIRFPKAAAGKITPSLNKSPFLPFWSEQFYQETLSLTDPAFATVTVVFGYSATYALLTALALGSILILALTLILILRSQALANPSTDPAEIRFSFGRALEWISLGTYIGWLSLWIGLQANVMLELALGAWLDTSVLQVLTAMLFALPPMLVVTVCQSLAYPVLVQTGTVEWTRQELTQQAWWTQVSTILPAVLAFTAIFSLSQGWLQMLLWLGASGFVRLIGEYFRVRAFDLTPYALTTGELRDHVFSLAQKAGVKLNQLYILPAGKSRMANAFAVQHHTVILTDFLLAHLNRREVNAVVAHEMVHLQRGHGNQQQWVLTLAFLIYLALYGILVHLISPILLILVGVAVVFLIYFSLSQTHEREADTQGTLLLGDAEAMITALAKVTRLNQMPLHWNRVQEQLSTHPSFRKRAELIATRHQISPERLDEILSPSSLTSPDPSDRYPLPTEETLPLFSTRFKEGVGLKILASKIAVCIAIPTLVALAVKLCYWQGSVQIAAYLIGAILTFLLLIGLMDWVPFRDFRRLSQTLAQRLQQAGIPVSQGICVGLAPHPDLRIYEGGMLNWDVGYLIPQADRLVYVGELTRFSLARWQITQATIKPSVDRLSYLQILWTPAQASSAQASSAQASAQRSSPQGFYLEPLSVSAGHQVRGKLQQIQAMIQQQPDPSHVLLPDLQQLPEPQWGTVTSQPLRRVFNPTPLLLVLLWIAFPIAVGLGLLLGLPMPGILYVLGMTTLGVMGYFLVTWLTVLIQDIR